MGGPHLSEFFMDLVFIQQIQENSGSWKQQIEEELMRALQSYGTFELSLRQENDLCIVTAETKGISPWQCEDDVLDHLEQKVTPVFWEWLQGYRIQVLVKEDAGCCKCKH